MIPVGPRTRSGGGGQALEGERLEWGVYVRTQIKRFETDSWFCVPLLLGALGVPHRSHGGFEGPERWSIFVDRHMKVLRTAGISAYGVVAQKGACVYPHEQVRLIGLESVVANHIGMWLVKVRWGGRSTVGGSSSPGGWRCRVRVRVRVKRFVVAGRQAAREVNESRVGLLGRK